MLKRVSFVVAVVAFKGMVLFGASPDYQKAAAMDKKYDGKPIPVKKLKNIHQLDSKIWTTDEIIADFEKNKTAQEVAIMVVVKTEFCSTNAYRACAVTTAVLETQPLENLKKFRIYMAWIKDERASADYPSMTRKQKSEWDRKLIDEYKFEQGPGAKIVLISPDRSKPYKVFTDAQEQKLYRRVILAGIGRDRLKTFDQTLTNFLTKTSELRRN